MVTRVFNLILATGMSLLALSVAMDASSRSWDAEAILYAIIAPCWLAGAIGLFFKSRLAWCGSLLGAGTMACSSVAIIGWSIILAPTAQDPERRNWLRYDYGSVWRGDVTTCDHWAREAAKAFAL